MSDPTPTDPTPDPAPQTDPTPAPTPDPDKGGEKDWQAEAEKWKAFSRKHEEQAKANADKAKRLDEIEEANKSEVEKALARAEKAENEKAEIEARATRAEVAAAKGVPVGLLTGSTREALEASADALVAFRGEQPKPDFGGGDRGKDVGGLTQVTESELNAMTPQQINTARSEGRLTALLSGKKP